MTRPLFRRREFNHGLACAALLATPDLSLGQSPPPLPAAPERRWYEAALAMKRLAESWGDQPYGAVLVLDDRIVGEGPSRVVQLGDPEAHAERVAIGDAQRRLGRLALDGSLLVSTSRPCALCESFAARARVARLVFGEGLQQVAPPRER